MYKLKFKKLPKVIKKHLKTNKAWKKYYPLDEANLLFSNAVSATKATGNITVVIVCPTGEPEYEFPMTIDPNKSLSEQVLEDFNAFLNSQQVEMETLYADPNKNKEKIKALEDDILILTNRAKEITQEFDNIEDEEDEEIPQGGSEEPEIMDAIVEEFMGDIPNEADLFGDVEEPADFPDDLFPDVEEIADVTTDDEVVPVEKPPTLAAKIKESMTPQKKVEAKVAENKVQTYLDVSTIEAIQALENQVHQLEGQIKRGVDTYIFDELYLTSATDFASMEKKELIKTKHLPQVNQTFESMRDWTQKSLEEIKRFATNGLNAKHDELNALKKETRKQRVMEMSEMLRVTFDKKKGELKKEIIAKRDAEIMEMEATLDVEKDQKLAVERSKIDQALAKGFNANHEKALNEHRGEIEKIAEEKANQVFETINKGYDGLLDEIKFNLGEHERDIEARHQLYREDRKDEFAQDISNRELQLRARQIEIEERKLLQNNETRLLSEQVEQLKITLEKNRLEDQMQLMSRDKADQDKEMKRFKRLVGISFVVMTLAMAGVVAFLL